jgi:hypothetical protein
MKYIFLSLLSYITVLSYFTLINPTPLRWWPLTFVAVILFYLNHDYHQALFMALICGLLTDLHFFYIGPYLITYSLIIYSVNYAKRKITVDKSVRALILTTATACFFYFVITLTLNGSLYGYYNYFPDSISWILYLIQWLITSASILVLQGAIKTLATARQKYA